MNIEELKDWRDNARRGLKREVEQLREKEEQIDEYLRALDATDELLAELVDLNDKAESLQKEINDLNAQLEQKDKTIVDLQQQLLEAREQRLASETKLSELSKLTAGVAKKSSQDNMIKAMRSYLNTSRRKTLGKREAAKMVLTELFTSAKMELPEDIMDLLAHLDDEQSEPKVVNVTGNYNDIHDNGGVDLNMEE